MAEESRGVRRGKIIFSLSIISAILGVSFLAGMLLEITARNCGQYTDQGVKHSYLLLSKC